MINPDAIHRGPAVTTSETETAAWYAYQQARLKSLCRNFVRDPRVIEDIVHETIARALAEDVGLNRRASGWLTTVAKNLCIDHLRRQAHARYSQMLVEAEDLDATAAFEAVIDGLDRSEKRRELASAIRTLKDIDRRVLWLHDVEGWEYTDIAEFEGTTAIASRCRASRARRALRRRLAASIGRGLGIAAALRTIAGRAQPQRLAFAAGVTTLVLGSLIVAEPLLQGPADVPQRVRSTHVDDDATVARTRAGRLAEPSVSVPGPAPESTTGPVDTDVGTRFRDPNNLAPSEISVDVVVYGPEGDRYFGSRTALGCERDLDHDPIHVGPARVAC